MTFKTLRPLWLLSGLLLAFTAAAEQNEPQAPQSTCAVLDTHKVPLHRDKRMLVITSHNGKVLFDNSTLGQVSPTSPVPISAEPFGRGSTFPQTRQHWGNYRVDRFALEPGIHHFTAIVAAKQPLNQTDLGRSIGRNRGGESIEFTINVEAGKFYSLIAVRTYPRNVNPRKQFHPEILSIKDSPCDASKINVIYPALPQKDTAVDGEALPNELATQLNQVLLEVKDYYADTAPQSHSLHIAKDSIVDPKFGIGGVTISLEQGQGLQINRLDADSTAATLGLKKGDVMLSVNGRSLAQNGSKVLSEELAKTQPQSNILFDILRDGQPLKLESPYQPQQLSAFSMDIEMD